MRAAMRCNAPRGVALVIVKPAGCFLPSSPGCCALSTPASKRVHPSVYVHQSADASGESEIALLSLRNFRCVLRRVVSFQITVLKVLAGQPGGCASLADLTRAV